MKKLLAYIASSSLVVDLSQHELIPPIQTVISVFNLFLDHITLCTQ